MNLLKARNIDGGTRTWVSEVVSQLTAGDDPRPRIDWHKLTDREQAELVEAVERATAGGRGIDRDELDDRWWRLVARASGWPEDHYSRRRSEAVAAAKEATKAADRRRLRLGRREQQNLLVILFDDMEAQKIWLDDSLVVLAVASMLAKGRPFEGAVARIEGHGLDASLHIDMRYGLAARVDGTDVLAGAQARLKYLAGEGGEDPLRGDERYFLIERSGQNWTISLGPRLRGALGSIDPKESA